MNKTIIEKHGLVVSCQALEHEPLHGSEHMAAMAKAAEIGGAVGIRANGEPDIIAIRKTVSLPIIGLKKVTYEGFETFITPTLQEAMDVAKAGADIVAIDGTRRKRPDGKTLEETIQALHAKNISVMADISTFEEGVYAASIGSDYVSTTLSGYTNYTLDSPVPNFDLLEKLVKSLTVPVIAEGNIKDGKAALKALQLGAQFVVVGSAITRPQHIVTSFVEEINKFHQQHKDKI